VSESIEWEVVRRQVAVCGRVLDEDDRPVEGAEVALYLGDVKQASDGGKSAKMDSNVRARATTCSRTDGLYFFLNSLAGEYTVTACTESPVQNGSARLAVAYEKDGSVKRATKDIQVKRGKM
jgi:protocatechuate 3,4-dioxygenase beta subunit